MPIEAIKAKFIKNLAFRSILRGIYYAKLAERLASCAMSVNKKFAHKKRRKMNKKKLFSEEYPIIMLNYHKGLIAYTYGYGEVSVPALYKIENFDKIVLKDIIKMKNDAVYYRITSFITFINNNTILYSVINPETVMTDIRLFNIITKKIKHIISIKNGIICDYFDNELIVYNTDGTRINFFSVDIRSNKIKKLNFKDLTKVYALGNNRYMGVGDNKHSGVYFINKDSNKRIFEKDGIGLMRSQLGNKLIIFIGKNDIDQIKIYENCFYKK